MKSRERWAEEQEQILKIYNEVKQELLRIPGVVEVGVGVKETGGSLTDEAAFRVYVNEKVPESALPSAHIIPKSIRGFRTDVLKVREYQNDIGFEDEDDWKNYSTKVGGIRIGNDKGVGTGTLGCFATLNSDNRVVFLSNEHVLRAGSATVGAKVGQPEYQKSCCCTCNEIGAVVDADATLDCAIATLNSGVAFHPKVKNIKQSDGTLELNGFISGSGNAVMGEEVWKVGAKTGLTRGTVAQTAPDLEVHPTAAFPTFRDHGDSGAVVVSLATGNVVGIHKRGSGPNGFATPIQAVLTRLGITITPTDATRTYDDAEIVDEREFAAGLPRDSPFASLVARLETSEGGRQILQLIRHHRCECLDLVNHRRNVTVVWHRSQGPTFLAALARSAKDSSYRIPEEIQGITRQQAAIHIHKAFDAHGSEALRTDLRTHAPLLREAFVHCDTVEDLLQAWEAAMHTASPAQLEAVH